MSEVRAHDALNGLRQHFVGNRMIKSVELQRHKQSAAGYLLRVQVVSPQVLPEKFGLPREWYGLGVFYEPPLRAAEPLRRAA